MGAALSNVQAEGGYLEDGKGLNVYDTLVVTPEPGIESQYSDTKVATDHYHHFKEDIDLMPKWALKLTVSQLFGHGYILMATMKLMKRD